MTGTMKTTSHICRLGMAALAVLAIAFVAFGEPTCGVDEAGVYYVNVPRNETATLQTDWANAAIANGGAFAKRGEGTLEAADVAGGGLVLGGDANIVFGEGSVLTVADVDSLPSAVRRISGMPIVTRTGTGTITGLPTLTGLPGKWKICMSEDGQSLNIHDMSGLIIIFR